MITRFTLLGGILLLGVLPLNAADVQVDLGGPGRNVSPNLFGVFLEEINHAGDGGILAELVRNGSFAEAETLDGWAPVRSGAAKVNVFFDTAMPISAAKPRSLRVDIEASAAEKAGVSNEGYWGMSVTKGTAYQFSASLRAGAVFPGPITVSIEGASGAVYAQQELTGIASAWNRVTASLTSNATDPKARLTISCTHTGTFWINLVSLRPAGNEIFRADLVQKIKDLKPAFLRFPGGTYVQGNDRASAFRWKNTIGKPEHRAGHWDAPWVYWSSDNLGYHEYLLLCEKLNAAPMYVAYGGMTWTPGTHSPFGVLQPHRLPVSDTPVDEMEPIVQEALDAIEYANGPVSSRWGAERAKAGHPGPFGLKYIEIGNEDGRNPFYAERYMLFYKAIKARFPEVQIISNSNRGANANLPMDLVDEHAYVRPTEALDMAKRYDTRDRQGPKVFLGEYAVQNAAGFGNMRAALCDAILLGSLERNSDLITMAAYAPLLANLNAVNWKPDLIYFDGATSFGTPSYQMHKMFADSRLVAVSPVIVNASEMKVPMSGDVTAQGFEAQVEVQDAKVAGSGDDYTYSLRARKTSGDGGLSVRFGIHDAGGSYLTWMLGAKRRGQLLVWGGGGLIDGPMYSLETSLGGPIGPQVPGTLEKDRWYDIRIRVQGRKVVCYLDGRQIQEATVPETLGPAVYAQAGRMASGNIVVRLINASPVRQDISIDLKGAAAPRYRASASQMSSKDLDAENTLAEPARIVPATQPEKSVGNQFHWDIEGNSITVLKLAPEAR